MNPVGVTDHTHIFIGYKPNISIPDLMRDVKVGSSGFINIKKWLPGKFDWQDGYGAFSYSHSQIDHMVKYVLNQEEHHKKMTFREEYLKFLKEFDVEYNEKYLFEFYDDIYNTH
ncbi:MAG: transposase [Bacteroidetes bacterium]|nr:transposase [Bacteroidota bacterium]